MGPFPELERELQNQRWQEGGEDPHDCYYEDDPCRDGEVDGFGIPY